MKKINKIYIHALFTKPSYSYSYYKDFNKLKTEGNKKIASDPYLAKPPSISLVSYGRPFPLGLSLPLGALLGPPPWSSSHLQPQSPALRPVTAAAHHRPTDSLLRHAVITDCCADGQAKRRRASPHTTPLPPHVSLLLQLLFLLLLLCLLLLELLFLLLLILLLLLLLLYISTVSISLWIITLTHSYSSLSFST